jgi:hypothetical protein
MPASARQSQNVPVSYPRRIKISPSQATQHAHLQGFSSSPLTDSNRRPPPYHGGFAPLPFGCEKRLVARFPCNRAGFSACSTPSLTAPEPPRETPNLSPELAPPQAVCVGEDGNIRVSLRNPRWRPSSVLAGGASGSEASAARGRRRRSAAHQGGECAHEQTRLRAARTRRPRPRRSTRGVNSVGSSIDSVDPALHGVVVGPPGVPDARRPPFDEPGALVGVSCADDIRDGDRSVRHWPLERADRRRAFEQPT